MSSPRPRRARVLGVALPCLLLPTGLDSAFGGITWQTGTFFQRHTPDLAFPSTNTSTVTVTNVAQSSSLSSTGAGYELNRNFSSGTGSSRGFCDLGYVTNATTATFTLGPGTGVSQSDPSGSFAQGSRTELNIGNLQWVPTGSGFGPTATAYLSFTVGGSLPVGGQARVTFNINFRYNDGVGSGTDVINFNNGAGTVILGGGGTFSLPVTRSALLSTATPARVFNMDGFIWFDAVAPGSPLFGGGGGPEGSEASCDLFDIDAGGAPPTWGYVPRVPPAPTFWNDGTTWIDDPQSFTAPNAPGVRARFGNDRGVVRDVILTNDITLGTLDSDGSATTTLDGGAGTFQNRFILNAGGTGAFGFDRVVINARNVAGEGTLRLQAPIQYDQPLQVNSDTQGGIIFDRNVTPGPGLANPSVERIGPGRVVVNGVFESTTFHASAGTTVFNLDQGELLPFSTSVIASQPGGPAAPTLVRFNVTQRLAALGVFGGAGVQLPASGAPVVLSLADLQMETPAVNQARINLGRGGLIEDYLIGNPSPATEIAELIAQAHGGGTWMEAGIGSGLAAANPSVIAVGYAEAAELGLAVFLGEPVDATAVLVRTTRVGDADLDGFTGIGDFARLAGNFNGPGSWAGGDFNYDLAVDLADFSLLAANFNRGLPADLPRGEVPEPSAAVMLGVIPLLRRRRRPD